MENAEYSQLLLKELMQGMCTILGIDFPYLTLDAFTETFALTYLLMVDSKPKKSGSGSLDAKFGEVWHLLIFSIIHLECVL